LKGRGKKRLVSRGRFRSSSELGQIESELRKYGGDRAPYCPHGGKQKDITRRPASTPQSTKNRLSEEEAVKVEMQMLGVLCLQEEGVRFVVGRGGRSTFPGLLELLEGGISLKEFRRNTHSTRKKKHCDRRKVT